VLRIPLPELVAVREDPLLRTRAFFIATGAADRGVEFMLIDRVE